MTSIKKVLFRLKIEKKASYATFEQYQMAVLASALSFDLENNRLGLAALLFTMEKLKLWRPGLDESAYKFELLKYPAPLTEQSSKVDKAKYVRSKRVCRVRLAK